MGRARVCHPVLGIHHQRLAQRGEQPLYPFAQAATATTDENTALTRSHWLGLDVHDVGSYRVDGEPRALEPGMVLTIEPGLYIPDAEDIPAAYRGIGIRIEDDIVITETGNENLTASVVKKPEEIEALMVAARKQ